VVDQRPIALGLARVQRLFQRIEHEVGAHRIAHAPAHDAARERRVKPSPREQRQE
jgi:hypothetical protein